MGITKIAESPAKTFNDLLSGAGKYILLINHLD